MAEQRFYIDINLKGNELKEVSLEKLANDPTGYPGRFYYNTGTNSVRYYDGSSWRDIGDDSEIESLISSYSTAQSSIDETQDSSISVINSTIVALESDILSEVDSLIDSYSATQSGVDEAQDSSISTIQSEISAIEDDISSQISTLESSIADEFSNVESYLTSTFESDIESLSNTQSGIDESQDSSISNIYSLLDDIAGESIASSLSEIFSTLSDHESSISTLEDSVSSIVSLLDDVDDSTISSIINAIDSSIPSEFSTVYSTIDDIDSTISETFSAISSDIESITSDLSTHIADDSNPHTVTLEQARTAQNGDPLMGDINMGGNTIYSLAEPTAPDEAATKAYVDAVAQGLKIRQHVELATTGALTATYADGSDPLEPAVGATLTNSGTQAALTIDGVLTTVGMRILVKNQGTQTHNGIYLVTTVGNESTNWVLTRSGEFDDEPTPELHAGDFFFVTRGSNNAATGWVVLAYNGGDPVVGTDPIVFSQFSGAGAYTEGGGIDITGTTISVNASEIAGTGLEQVTGAGNEHKLQVVGYTPITDTTVARKRTWTGQSIVGNTPFTLTHNFGTSVIVEVYDEADGEKVGVGIDVTSTNAFNVLSNISFTATIIVIG